MSLRSAFLVAMLLLAGCSGATPDVPADVPETMDGLPLVFYDDFSAGADRWEMTDPNAWFVVEDAGDPVLALIQQSDYEPPVRSPRNMALVRDLWVSDFVLEARLKSTTRDYDHRDLCVFYGWQDPANFYYTHIANAADPHANSIFLVDDEPRVSIAAERTDGTDWSGGYHTVRVVRDVEAGTIEVFFDDLETPIMRATDERFAFGRVGFGSFDDSGFFDDVRVWGRLLER